MKYHIALDSWSLYKLTMTYIHHVWDRFSNMFMFISIHVKQLSLMTTLNPFLVYNVSWNVSFVNKLYNNKIHQQIKSASKTPQNVRCICNEATQCSYCVYVKSCVYPVIHCVVHPRAPAYCVSFWAFCHSSEAAPERALNNKDIDMKWYK